jgi:hypothetical protein
LRVKNRASIAALTRPERIKDGCLYAYSMTYRELVDDEPAPQPLSPPSSPPPSPEFADGPLSDASDEL